jgi:hypothetical protein
MIQEIQLGDVSMDVLHVRFGTGDIMMSQIEMDNDKFSLSFCEMGGRKIGETTTEFVGKSTDDFGTEVKLVMSFSKPESVTALIHSLVELQKRIYDSMEKG